MPFYGRNGKKEEEGAPEGSSIMNERDPATNGTLRLMMIEMK